MPSPITSSIAGFDGVAEGLVLDLDPVRVGAWHAAYPTPADEALARRRGSP